MDVTVYGMENSYALKKALTKTRLPEKLGVKRFEGEKLKQWFINKTQNHPLSVADAERIFERKWNIGTFDETLFSIHPVKLEKELTEKYGDKKYSPARMVTIRAVVTDSEDSIFLPAVYKIRDIEIEEEVETDIEEVVSYEGLYDSLAEKGETLEVKGKLEHVIDNRSGRKYDRVLVGSPEGKGREYIKPID
jgi:predicted nucleotidyltransferase